jgi:DNA-binding transcriptional regulator YhcF (GntR family)
LEAVIARLDEPTARGLAAAVSRAIGDGALSAGDKLPPIRRVASELRLSPTTVSAAWQLLARSGAIHADGRRGTVVAEPRATGPRRYRRALRQRAAFALDLSTGVPDPALLPDLGDALRRLHSSTPLPTSPSSYLDEPVLPGLADLLWERWPFPAERLAVFDGAMDAIDHVASSLLRLGDRAIVENPCFPPLLDLLDALGVQAIGVGLDAEGVLPSDLATALTQRPVAAFLQPRAQNPTGRVLVAEARGRPDSPRCSRPAGAPTSSGTTRPVTSPPRAVLSLACVACPTVRIGSFLKSHGPISRLTRRGRRAGGDLDPHPRSDSCSARAGPAGCCSRSLLDLLTDLATAVADGLGGRARECARRRRRAAHRASPPNSAEGVGRRDGGDGINLWLPVEDRPGGPDQPRQRGQGGGQGGLRRRLIAPHLRASPWASIGGTMPTSPERLARAARAGTQPFSASPCRADR